jgi:hypothetical protein
MSGWLALSAAGLLAGAGALRSRGARNEDCETVAFRSCPGRRPRIEARMTFKGLSEKKLGHLFKAEAELAKAGITFDTGYAFGPRERDWEWDWSLRGPVEVNFVRLHGKGSRAVVQLGSLIEVGADSFHADFWLRVSGKDAGRPSETPLPGALGVRVVRTDVLVPRYLYYVMEYLWSQGFWRARKVTAAAVRAIQVDLPGGANGNGSADRRRAGGRSQVPQVGPKELRVLPPRTTRRHRGSRFLSSEEGGPEWHRHGTFRIHSTAMMHAPGLVRFAQEAWRSDPDWALEFLEGMGLHPEPAEALASGRVKFTPRARPRAAPPVSPTAGDPRQRAARRRGRAPWSSAWSGPTW